MSDYTEYKKYLDFEIEKRDIKIKQLQTEIAEIKDKNERIIIDYWNYLKFLGVDEKKLRTQTILAFEDSYSREEIVEILDLGRFL